MIAAECVKRGWTTIRLSATPCCGPFSGFGGPTDDNAARKYLNMCISSGDIIRGDTTDTNARPVKGTTLDFRQRFPRPTYKPSALQLVRVAGAHYCANFVFQVATLPQHPPSLTPEIRQRWTGWTGTPFNSSCWSFGFRFPQKSFSRLPQS